MDSSQQAKLLASVGLDDYEVWAEWEASLSGRDRTAADAVTQWYDLDDDFQRKIKNEDVPESIRQLSKHQDNLLADYFQAAYIGTLTRPKLPVPLEERKGSAH
jgi:hypothetical protein